MARAEQHQAEQQRYAGGGEQGGEPGLQVDGGALLQQAVENVGLDLHPRRGAEAGRQRGDIAVAEARRGGADQTKRSRSRLFGTSPRNTLT